MARPRQTAFGKDLYPTSFEKAAALLESIARNHGFRDGNKRTAMAAAYLFLALQGVKPEFTNQAYEAFMLYVVNQKPNLAGIVEWLQTHSA